MKINTSTLKIMFSRPQIYISIVLITLILFASLVLGSGEPRDVFTPVQGYLTLYNQSPLLYWIFLIWPSIPFATMLLEHRQDNLQPYLIFRMEASKYYTSLFLINFIFVFFISVVVLTLLFLPSLGCFTGTLEDAMRFDDGYFRNYSKYLFAKPYLFLSIFILFKSFAAAVFASLALGFSYFIKNLYFVYLSVFLFNALLSIGGHYLSTLQIAPYYAATPYALSNYAIGTAILVLLIYLILSYVIPKVYFLQDYR